MDGEEISSERKEIFPLYSMIPQILFAIFLAIANLMMIYYVIYNYVTRELYNLESSFVWIIMFFISQVFGFFGTGLIALRVLASI